ncbi:metallophosphoesterase [Sporosarcina jiandibaonis]|uniref:metallophosphoesterase n=1 Tax=Sporosarcina jiandibaonis TaxID=2715535 RepID=UPI001556216C|nr:metallophosphoesterase [Sporosarcina jiandibaonis]
MFLLFTIFIVTILSIVFYKGYQNTKQVLVNNVFINNSNANTQVDEEPFRVLHISDMHLENISVSPSHLYSILKNQHIDLIALTGDFLDRKRSIPKLLPYLKVLNKLNPKHGTYAVFGNHDYVLQHPEFTKLKQLLEDNGCKTMINENDVLSINGERVNIIGIDDFSTNRSNIDKSFEGIKNGYNLVLTHDPNIVLNMENVSYDYLLSGHFHGGQIHWPKPYHLVKMGKLVRLNMIKGLHKHKGKPFYISEGLGQTGVNIRFGSRPEITLHHLTLTSAL